MEESMTVITVVTRILPLTDEAADTSNLLKPSELGKPIEVHKCVAVDPRTGVKFLLETTFCLGKTKDLGNLQIPGLVPLDSSNVTLNNEPSKDFALSVPRTIPIHKIPKLHKLVTNNDLQNSHCNKPSIKLHLNLKAIREATKATKKRHLIRKKEKLVRPLFNYFINNECLICGVFLTESHKNEIMTHMFSHIKRGTYACQICEHEYFSSAEGLYSHSLEHVEKLPYSCNVCNKKFSRKFFLTSHTEESHCGYLYKESLLLLNFVCSLCKIKLTSWKSVVNHKKVHPGTEEYSCSYCNETFSASSSLLRYHAHKKNLVFNFHKCKSCRKVFHSRCKLKKHAKTHLKKRFQHLCTFCGKKFNFKNNLMKHIQLHNQNF